jgi:uracil-DNA glycosylase family 4
MANKPYGKRCNVLDCPNIALKEVPFSGGKGQKLMFIGESPGYNEELQGAPFVGDAGEMARGCAQEAGLSWASLFIANSARCRIHKEKLSTKEVNAVLTSCRPNVIRVIQAVKPKAIICAGDMALRQILKKSGITKIRGRWIWSPEFKCWTLPTFHPAYILRNRALRPLLVDDLRSVVEFVKNGYKPLTVDDRDRNYREVDSIQFILDRVKKEKFVRVSLDTEDQGLDWLSPNFVCISASIGYAEGEAVDVVFHEETTKGKEDFTIKWPRMADGKKKFAETDVYVRRTKHFDRKLSEIKQLLEHPRIYKMMMNGSFDEHAIGALFRREGMDPPVLRGFSVDVQAAAHVIEENVYRMANLTVIQRNFTPIKEDYNQEFELKYGKSDMLAVPREARTEYACRDADVTYQAGIRIREILTKKENRKLLNYVVKFVQPTLQSLANMEKHGSYVDQEIMPKIKEEVFDMMMDAQKVAMKNVPTPVLELHKEKNDKKKDGIYLTRRDFVRDVIFHQGGFRCKPLRLTKGSKEPSVDKHVLSELLDGKLPKKARVFVDKYKDFTEYHTLWSRYLNGFAKHIKPDGRIHSQLSLAVAVTGRVSSSKPNMMNNPKRSKTAKKVRRLIAAPPGWLLLEVDQSQAELRWAAHVARESNMIRLFREDKIDIHTATAMDLKGVKSWAEWQKLDEQVRWTARRDAKSVNFGLLFGMTVNGFIKYAKEEYGILLSFNQAQAWVDIFFRKYPRLKVYHRSIVESCRIHGYVESPLGRRRRLPEINSTEKFLRLEAERQAINSPIQSPSSDTVLIALNEMDKKDMFHPDYFMPSLFIHDSLIFEVKDCSKAEDYVKMVIHEMENPPLERDFGVKLLVPLKAEAEIGPNAAEMKEVNLAA